MKCTEENFIDFIINRRFFLSKSFTFNSNFNFHFLFLVEGVILILNFKERILNYFSKIFTSTKVAKT